MLDLELLQHAVMDSRDGITIADARSEDMPLIFVNPAFERMTGYRHDAVVGYNCRFLQGEERDPEEHADLRRAFDNGRGHSKVLRNYRRDGTLFWNELSVSPIHNERGEVTHFIGFQKDVTDRVILDERLRSQKRDLELAKESLERLVTIDSLTGVYNRRHFDDRMSTLWKISRRTGEPIALFFIDIDYFKQFNDRFGHPAGDDALIAVATALADSFQRGSDFLARYGGEEFVVVACGMEHEEAGHFAQRLCDRIAALEIEQPDLDPPRLTISVGYALMVAEGDVEPRDLLDRADRALFRAKRSGRNRALPEG